MRTTQNTISPLGRIYSLMRELIDADSQNSQHEETVFVKPEKIQIPNIDAYLEANKTEYPSSDMRIAARNECEWAMNHVQNQGKGWNK